jgi:hypothetical protein
MAIAHAFHKDTFERPSRRSTSSTRSNPDDRATVQRIYLAQSGRGAGELAQAVARRWPKSAMTRRPIGSASAKETREALMKDPEFRKQLVADCEARLPGRDPMAVRVPPPACRDR